MSADNKLLKYVQAVGNCKDNDDIDIRDNRLNKLIALTRENPIEFTCTVVDAYKELEIEFQNRREALDNAISQIVIETIRLDYKDKHRQV